MADVRQPGVEADGDAAEAVKVAKPVNSTAIYGKRAAAMGQVH
jgi:hypothetical protein